MIKFANLLIDFAKNKLYDRKTGYFYNSQGADIVDDEGNLLITGEEYFTKDKEGREILEEAVGYSPKIEKNIYFSNNSLMISALVYSYIYNNNKDDLKIAEKLANNIIKEGWGKYGIIHSKNVKEYYLSTQVYFLEALLNLYQATGNKFYLKKTVDLANIIKNNYYSKKLGIFVDLKETGFNISNISFIDDVFALNSRVVRVFYQISAFTSNDIYFETAKKITEKLPTNSNIDTGLSYFVVLYPPTVLHIVGYEKDRYKFISESFKVFPYYNFTQFVYFNDNELLQKIGYKADKETAIYLCNINMCFRKINENELNNLRNYIFETLSNYKKIK